MVARINIGNIVWRRAELLWVMGSCKVLQSVGAAKGYKTATFVE